MKVSWTWTEEDVSRFPHLSEREFSFDVIPDSCEDRKDVLWRIATEIYRRTGVVCSSERDILAHADFPGKDSP